MVHGDEVYWRWKWVIYALKEGLLKRRDLMERYASLLEDSEADSVRGGADVYSMILRTMHEISGNYKSIPGTELQNFVAVVGGVQRETGLDLGICRFLDDNVVNSMKVDYLGWTGLELNPMCLALPTEENVYVDSLDLCLPPKRSKCLWRELGLGVEAVFSMYGIMMQTEFSLN